MHKQKQEAFEREQKYSLNPIVCLTCKSPISYNKKFNKFCSHSCSAVFQNTKRKELGWKPSEEQKLKTSISLKGRKGHTKIKGRILVSRVNRTCPECKNIFFVTPKNNKKYCTKECAKKNIGGVRENSGRSKSGYYKGIFCGSTYELAWVIYRLDQKLPLSRFNGYILYENNKKYYPDFLVDKTIFEIKGYLTENGKIVTNQKAVAAISNGYKFKLLFREDLEKEFEWVKNNYTYSCISELYDNYKPRYQKICKNCKIEFSTNNKKRTRCSNTCKGTPKGFHFKI